MMRLRLWLPLALVVLAGGAIGGCGEGDESTSGTAVSPIAGGQPTAAALVPNTMAVDADPATPAVEDSTTQPLDVPFEVSINVTSVADDYSLYQFTLRWDPSKISLVSGTHVSPDQFVICGGFTKRDGGVFTLCARPREAGETSYTGQMDKITLKCTAPGTANLRLQSIAEDETFGSSTFNPGGFYSPTDVSDASVTCG